MSNTVEHSSWREETLEEAPDGTSAGPLRRREFQLQRGTRPIPGVLWQRADAAPGAPLVCFGHGASGTRHQPPIPHLARRLVREHGFFALSIDGPVHGRRQVGEGGRKAFWPEFQRPGCVADMVADWRLVIDWVHALPDVGRGRMGYWGLSMGTIFGAPLLAELGTFDAAVLGLMGIAGPDHYLPTIEAAARRISCPVFFVQQLEDELFTRAQYEALFDALASTDKRLHANPGLHPQVPPEELDFSVRFLAAYLAGDGFPRDSAFQVSD